MIENAREIARDVSGGTLMPEYPQAIETDNLETLGSKTLADRFVRSTPTADGRGQRTGRGLDRCVGARNFDKRQVADVFLFRGRRCRWADRRLLEQQRVTPMPRHVAHSKKSTCRHSIANQVTAAAI